MVTLRQLEIFLAVAGRQHVTEAAADVHLSQSAVSAAMSELAAGLGGALFERVGRGVRLNDRGRQLVEDAADLLQRAKDLVQRFSGVDALAGRLKIGASSTIGTYLLPQRVGAFVAAHREVFVDLEMGNSADIEARLQDHELDLAFIEGPSRQPALVATPWREDELVVFVAAGHALAKRKRLAPERMPALRWIMREQGSGTRSVFETALQAHGVQVVPYLQFGHSEAVKQAVHAGLGVGCLSKLTVAREIEAREFVVLRTPGLDLRRQLWRLARKAGYQSRLVTACVAALADPIVDRSPIRD